MDTFLSVFASPAFAPWGWLALFLGSSFLLVWRLNALGSHGLEGTVLGTLVTPYCSGLGNLLFVFIAARTGAPAQEVVINSLVNNVTNLTLLLGLPALIWGLPVLPAAKGKTNRTPARSGKKTAARRKPGSKETLAPRLNRLSLLLTLSAALFFAGVAWALGHDGELSPYDGAVLVGSFLFWQALQAFEVLKNNLRENRRLPATLPVELLLLGAGAYGLYVGIDGIVAWIGAQKEGFFASGRLGWITGWLMVLPNGVLAIYYAWRGRADIVYSSQVGDGHICIPLCLGLASLGGAVALPPVFAVGLALLTAAALLHLLFLLLGGGLPRWAGAFLVAGYGLFLAVGL